MFLGTHTLRLDEKGRLILPAKFRADLEGGVVITKGQEHCLYVWTATEFRRQAEPLEAKPVTDREARAYNRVFFASAYDELPDKQGRVTIPPYLRDYAGLDRDVVVIGASNRVEIWDQQAWSEFLAATEESYSDIAEGASSAGP
jgi:MraZ protein